MEENNKKSNKSLFIRILEILFAICIGGTGLVMFLMTPDNTWTVLWILISIGIMAIAVGLIVGLEKGSKTVKKRCTVLGILCICAIIGVALYNYNESKNTVTSADKPIIYLYPEEETEVTVELGNSKSITVSYPKYLTGWNVLAEPDGTLTDLTTGKSLYALYYESEANVNFEVTNEGFCVKGEDVAEFLEEKLAILGLTEREAEEFIIYWLPKLQENEYNYIRFATAEEIEENMPLEINPNPDTVIRVLMTYKGLDESIDVEEQELETPERKGFVAVEWGGTEIK